MIYIWSRPVAVFSGQRLGGECITISDSFGDRILDRFPLTRQVLQLWASDGDGWGFVYVWLLNFKIKNKCVDSEKTIYEAPYSVDRYLKINVLRLKKRFMKHHTVLKGI